METVKKATPTENRVIKLVFLNNPGDYFARAHGNNAAWICVCGNLLIGRCQPDTMVTDCVICEKRYRVIPNKKENEPAYATQVVEEKVPKS